ncbi:hypothetical protein CSOJ01_07831 [Colletotrichum sojae]|uniref:Uncharacterized protein n=1 Tax=Colletotrichum sojae TaxID=2175907 RepID=A0A8H6J8I4_9PEZI|nr:hypothetical protein CSOJ01_07831 [Colletotrichum sojae]
MPLASRNCGLRAGMTSTGDPVRTACTTLGVGRETSAPGRLAMGHGVACSEAREWQRTGPDGVVSASQTKHRGAQDELLALPAACLNNTLIITPKDAVCSAGARRGEASIWRNETRRKFGEVGELFVVPSSLNSLPSPHPPRPVFMFIARSWLYNGIRIMSCKQADLHLFEIFVSRSWHGMA